MNEEEIEIIGKLSCFIPLLKEYSKYLQSFELKKEAKIEYHERVFLDLEYKHLANIKAVIALLELLIEDNSVKIPLSNVLRGLSADILTSEYLLTIRKQNPSWFDAELDCLSIEYQRMQQELNEVFKKEDVTCAEIDSRLVNKFGNYKTREEVFKGKEVPEGLLRGNNLSERKKYNFIMKKNPQAHWVKYAFSLNKVFTQYYHYNMSGGQMAQAFPIKELHYMFDVICFSIIAMYTSLAITEKFFPSDFGEKLKEYHNKLFKYTTLESLKKNAV